MVVFSTVYATMSYVIIYFLNIMWMDALIYLPLILIGVDQLVHKKKTVLFTISLALLFISNFYVAYMVGIFVFLYFLAKVIQEVKIGTKVIRLFSLFMVSTFIAAGLSAFILFPTYLALNESVNKMEIVPEWEFLFPSLQLVGKFFFGSYSSIVNGIPNIYAGTLPLLLTCLFLFIKGITYKEKLVYLSIFFLFLFSFEVPALNLIWHAFDQPNLYPYRYSFLFSFVIVYLSYRVFQNLQKAEAPKLIAAYVFLVTVAIFVQKQSFSSMTERALMIHLFLLTVFVILLILKVYHPSKKEIVNVMLLCLVVFDMTANGYHMLKYVREESPSINRDAFLEGNQIEGIAQQLREYDSSIYRAEVEEPLFRKNGPLRYDFKGFKHFSSMIDQDTVKAMDDLGYTTYYEKWYTNKGGTLVADSLLGLKYFMKETPNMDRFGFFEVEGLVDANYTVYQNDNALPIGYYVKSAPAVIENGVNPFDLQNKILQQMVGSSASYFKALSIKEERLENIEAREKEGQTMWVKRNEDKQGMIQYTLDIKGKQQLYLLAASKNNESVTVFVNGQELEEYLTIFNKGTLELGLFENEKVTVTLLLNTAAFNATELEFYGLNTALYSQAIKTLKQEPMTFTNWTSRTFTASISNEKDGLVFLSIPHDRGWTVKVDDVKVKPKIAMGAFMLIPIQEGTHTISMSYVPPGFKQGFIISVVSLCVFIGFQLVIRKRYLDKDNIRNYDNPVSF
ncbi:putative membrane protein YfhO [Bacillus fengqiuensis]|nr:putative membrane protein YfhO [Bacillus fengqiuensis]